MSDTDYPIYDFDPRNLPQDVLEAVGLMAMASAQTESILQQFIGGLLGIDSLEALAIGLHMSFPLKRDIAKALIELNGVNVQTIDIVDDLLDAIDEALKARNVVVQNSMVRHPDTGEVLSYRESARGSLSLSLQPISVEKMQEDAALIYRVGMDLMTFMVTYGVQPADRTRPVRAPVNRGKKARHLRKEGGVRDA